MSKMAKTGNNTYLAYLDIHHMPYAIQQSAFIIMKFSSFFFFFLRIFLWHYIESFPFHGTWSLKPWLWFGFCSFSCFDAFPYPVWLNERGPKTNVFLVFRKEKEVKRKKRKKFYFLFVIGMLSWSKFTTLDICSPIYTIIWILTYRHRCLLHWWQCETQVLWANPKAQSTEHTSAVLMVSWILMRCWSTLSTSQQSAVSILFWWKVVNILIISSYHFDVFRKIQQNFLCAMATIIVRCTQWSMLKLNLCMDIYVLLIKCVTDVGWSMVVALKCCSHFLSHF